MEIKRVMASKEMLKLDALLTVADIPHETSLLVMVDEPTIQIHVPSIKEAKADAVSHQFSYGGRMLSAGSRQKKRSRISVTQQETTKAER